MRKRMINTIMCCGDTHVDDETELSRASIETSTLSKPCIYFKGKVVEMKGVNAVIIGYLNDSLFKSNCVINNGHVDIIINKIVWIKIISIDTDNTLTIDVYHSKKEIKEIKEINGIDIDWCSIDEPSR